MEYKNQKHRILQTLLALCLLIVLTSCSKSDPTSDMFLDCDNLLGEYKLYNNEDIECQFHYALTEYNNQQFIELIAHCADLSRPFVINENCEDICETLPRDENSDCNKYLNERTTLRILLIEK